MLLGVKGYEAFTVSRAANLNLCTGKAGVVKRVHGLTVFEHYVVCNVNDIVYGTNTACAESHSEPKGRGSDFYVLNNSCTVSCTKITVKNVNLNVVFNVVAIISTLNYGCRTSPRTVEAHRSLSCKTDNGETVGTV